MKLRFPVVFVFALVAVAETAPVLSRQAAAPAIVPKEMAAVQRIRARIEERSAKAAAAKPAPYKVTLPNTTFEYGMAPIPAGEFLMGATGPGAKPDQQPQHKVRVGAFWMQTHEITWDAYLMFMFADQAKEVGHADDVVDALSRPTAPFVEMSFGRGSGGGFPAISMTQHAANKFAEWMSAKTGEYYRLPTEAEWEYACRAGTATGIEPGALGDYAWFAANSPQGAYTTGTYHKVGTKKPNAWGLYDMLGNVMEWTLDQYAPYTAPPAENPWVKATAPYPHAVRGGSWSNDEAAVSCTVRVPSDPSWKKQDPQLPKSIWYMTDAQWVGFRLVRPATLPSAEEMYRAWNSGVELDPY
jgi:formylglycine-generating enzyme required for sulfatase activity